MEESQWRQIERERLTLADLLEALTPGEWEGPSLCARWRVRDVAAHLAMTPIPEPGMGTLVAALVRSRGHLWEAAAQIAIDFAQRPTEALTEELRRQATSRSLPRMSNPDNMLLDILVHGQDIAIPLQIEREMPLPAAQRSLERAWRMGWPFHAQRRLRGLHVSATDADVHLGDPEGQPVRGRTGDLLMLVTGRTAAVLPRLSGAGVPLIQTPVERKSLATD